MDPQPLRRVPRAQNVDGIVRHVWRRRDFGQWPAVRAQESQFAVGLSLHLVTLLVNCAMVPATEQRQVRERGRPAVGPVADVMTLTERTAAAREAATPVAVMEHAPERRRNGPGPGADLHDAAILKDRLPRRIPARPPAAEPPSAFPRKRLPDRAASVARAC